MMPTNSISMACDADANDRNWCNFHGQFHKSSTDDEIEVTFTVKARVKPGYTAAEVGDVVRFNLGLSDLDSIEADVSAVHIYEVHQENP